MSRRRSHSRPSSRHPGLYGQVSVSTVIKTVRGILVLVATFHKYNRNTLAFALGSHLWFVPRSAVSGGGKAGNQRDIFRGCPGGPSLGGNAPAPWFFTCGAFAESSQPARSVRSAPEI